MKNASIILAFAALLLSALPAKADVWWRWSFAGESGYFLTDGKISDTVVNHTFKVKDFAVTESNYSVEKGTLSEGKYRISQPYIGFEWSGTGVTQFFRDSGNYTNGATINVSKLENRAYSFAPNQGAGSSNSKFWDPGAYINYATDPLNLISLNPDTVARPDLLIGKNSSPSTQLGQDIYSSGSGQKMTVRTKDRKKAKFYFSANTDADVPEGFLIRSNGGNRYFKVKYLAWDGSRWVNQTGSIKGRGFVTPRYFPENSANFQVQVKPMTDGRRKSRTLRCMATSRADGSITDTVKAKVKTAR